MAKEDRDAAKTAISGAKAKRAALKALAATTGNLTNAQRSDALRDLATAVVRIERALALLTSPQSDDLT